MRRLEEKIRSRQFVVTTELTPPKGVDLSELLAKADFLRDHVDGINLTESPRARMTVEPKSVAHLLLDRGVEPIVQITARDRNRIAIQADVLGAALLGVTNFLFLSGDPPQNGDHPDAKPVFDMRAAEMVRAARALSQGRDMAGNELKGAPHVFVGATASPAAPDLAAEVENTRRKADAGAQFLQTQAVYDVEALQRFIAAARLEGVALLAGIIPLKSARMAVWLNENVPGIRVPDALLRELQDAAGTEQEAQKGMEIAARTIREIRSMCAGVHIMAMGWENRIPQILEASGLRR